MISSTIRSRRPSRVAMRNGRKPRGRRCLRDQVQVSGLRSSDLSHSLRRPTVFEKVPHLSAGCHCVGSCQGDALPHPNFSRTEGWCVPPLLAPVSPGHQPAGKLDLNKRFGERWVCRTCRKSCLFFVHAETAIFPPFGYAVSVIALFRSIYWMSLHGCTNGTVFAE